MKGGRASNESDDCGRLEICVYLLAHVGRVVGVKVCVAVAVLFFLRRHPKKGMVVVSVDSLLPSSIMLFAY